MSYEFEISRHEVTNAQYAEYLNAVAKRDDGRHIWAQSMAEPLISDGGQGGIMENLPVFMKRKPTAMGFRYECLAGWETKPVVYVSFVDAMRFANWLHNGKGDTENGAYDLRKGGLAMRSANARYWIPSEDEWYKAAYYEQTADGGRYWKFATRSDVMPTQSKKPSDKANVANFEQTHEYRYTVAVGSYPNAASFYGTLDQNGNAWEWTEGLIFGAKRVIRGGSVAHVGLMMESKTRMNASPEKNYPDTGFRMARRSSDAR